MSQYQFTPLTGVLLVTFFIALHVAGTVWRRRAVPGAIYLALAEFGIAYWALIAVFEVAALTVDLKTFWYVVLYPGVVFASPLFFLFASTYSQQTSSTSAKQIALLLVVPVLTLVAVTTNGWHFLYWKEVHINPAINMAVYVRGPLFWVNTVYSYLLISAGIARLYLATIRFSKFHQRQTKELLLGFTVPFAANIFCISGFNPVPGLDWTLLAFSISGMILSWALFRGSVFQYVPMARDLLMDMVEEGVLLLDPQNRIADINPTFVKCLNKPLTELIGRPVAQGFADWDELTDFFNCETQTEAHLRTIQGSGEVFYYLRLSPMHDKHGRLIGKLVFLRDITPSKVLEKEKARLAEGLEDALAYVKTLSGLLPICAQCKKIRDDQGQWQPVEEYVRERTNAEFSHSICPECVRQLYPDVGR